VAAVGTALNRLGATSRDTWCCSSCNFTTEPVSCSSVRSFYRRVKANLCIATHLLKVLLMSPGKEDADAERSGRKNSQAESKANEAQGMVNSCQFMEWVIIRLPLSTEMHIRE